MGQVVRSIHAYQPQRNPVPNLPDHVQIVLSPGWEKELTVFERLERRQWVPITLNLPCSLVQLPYVILNPAKQEWIPRNMDLNTWRALTWPLVGFLFWWAAGRGIDALIAARRRLICPRITWIEAITGAALSLFCTIATVCLPLFSGHQDEDFPMKLVVAGLGMWAVLGGVVVAARVAQWRVRRRPSLADAPEVSPA